MTTVPAAVRAPITVPELLALMKAYSEAIQTMRQLLMYDNGSQEFIDARRAIATADEMGE